MNEDWINKIRQKMEHYEADVPDGLYDEIQQEMLRRGLNPMAANTGKKRIFPVWNRRMVISVVSAAAVLLTAILVLNLPDTERQSIASLPASINAVHPQEEASVKGVEEGIEAQKTQFMANSTIASAPGKYSTTEHLLADNYTGTTPILNNQDTEPECEVVEPRQTSVPSTGVKSSQSETKKGYDYPISTVTRHSHQVAVGAYVQGMQVDKQNSVGMNYLASGEPIYGDGNKLTPNDAVQLPGAQTAERTHHKLPVKGGISLRYAINDRWSVQTGVNYSYHSSEIEIGNQQIDQRLHFIGVPVAVGYNVWSNSKVGVYVTAGGEVEKMIKGHRSVTYTGQHREEDVKMSRPLLSAQLSAGAEYSASKAVSVYVEPNVSYHFNNGSDISTIYKDKPLELGISMGVRVTVGR